MDGFGRPVEAAVRRLGIHSDFSSTGLAGVHPEVCRSQGAARAGYSAGARCCSTARTDGVRAHPDRPLRGDAVPVGGLPARRDRSGACAVRIWRGAPIWGAALWVLSEMFVQQVVGPWPTFAVSTSAVIALAAVARAKAGETRKRVRAMSVVTMPEVHRRGDSRRPRGAAGEGHDVDVRRRTRRRGAHVAPRPRGALVAGLRAVSARSSSHQRPENAALKRRVGVQTRTPRCDWAR